MALKHGINTYKSGANAISVKEAGVGIPFFVGAWPCHVADGYTGNPQLVTSYAEAVELGGYSDEWRDSSGNPKWSLCQCVYSHLKLFGMQPAIFMNVFNPSEHYTAVAAADYTVTDYEVQLPNSALIDNGLVVMDSAGENTLTKDTDYTADYDDDYLVITLLSGGSYYSQTALNIAYNNADPSTITMADIEDGLDAIDTCKSVLGIVPDLICIPGWSINPTIAALMATKAESITELYKAKAVVDIDTSATGADAYSGVLSWKTTNGYTDETMIVCWPMVKNGDLVFDLSVQLCGLMASIDQGNGDCPYESPSNKDLEITGAVLKDGTEVNLTLPQADVVSVTDGVVTALNFGSWVAWGNYTGCWSAGNTDVSEYFICCNRMMDWICNTFVNTYWSSIDRPLTKPLINAIVSSFNIWMNGLTHEGKLYGGELQYIAANNPTTSLIAGTLRLDAAVASPVPAQRIDMYEEYDVDLLTAALS